MTRLLDTWDWLRNYQRKDFSGDLFAGLTIGVMLIPQGMAYALLAGVDPIQGLYAAAIAMLVYMVAGTSRQLMIGPVAMDALLVAAVLKPIADASSSLYITLAMMLALMVGVTQVIMGIARMGFLVNFLSRPVLRGFTTGAPIIIAISQLKHLLGVDLRKGQQVFLTLGDAVTKVAQYNYQAVTIGVGAIVLLFAMKRWTPRLPAPLIVVIISILGTWLLKLDVAIVGEVPPGLPSLAVPAFDWSHFQTLIGAAIAIAIIGYMEGISIAKVYAEKEKQKLRDNQELVALGLANIAVAFFRGFPIGGSFSRTAVNKEAGVKTPLANGIASIVIILTLLFLTGLFYYLPKAVLAAVVVVAVSSLIRFQEMRVLFTIKRSEGVLFLITFLGTLIFGALQGLGLGLACSLVPILLRLSRPHTVELGIMPDGREFRDLERNPTTTRLPGILLLRIDASFCFLNASYLRDKIAAYTRGQDDLQAVIVDAGSINDLDGTAFEILHRTAQSLHERGIYLYITGVKGPVRDILRRGGLWGEIGDDHFCINPYEAIQDLRRRTHLLSECTQGAGI